MTNQALGADFFNAEAFPTANYAAEIIAGPDGYIAEGTLTITDQSMPLSFPFTLDVQDGTAVMSASSSIDRRDFGIGAGTQPDESNVGFAVGVNISLTATQSSD